MGYRQSVVEENIAHTARVGQMNKIDVEFLLPLSAKLALFTSESSYFQH